MILLWGVSGDRPLAAVEAALRQHGAPVVLLDQRDVVDTEMELRVEPQPEGRLRLRGTEIELNQVTAVYLRLYDVAGLPNIAADSNGSLKAQAYDVQSMLLSWIDMRQLLVVNPPSAMARINSKPYQATLLQQLGLAVPATLITTDASAARAFWDLHGEVVYKSVSSVRSVVSRLRETDRERLSDVSVCPTLFQEYVPGTDYRVHVVGNQIFACEIRSAADDYRYPQRQGATVRISATQLPLDIRDRCSTVVKALGLYVGGVDLRLTPERTWVCFEVNPSPNFAYYESSTQQPIAAAVADLLTKSLPPW